MTHAGLTIGRIGALIAGLALAFAAMKDGSFGSYLAVLIATILTCQAAIILSVIREQSGRAFWLGFALVGFPCLVVGQAPTVRPWLPSRHLLAGLAGLIPSETVDLSAMTDVDRARARFFPPGGRSRSEIVLGFDGLSGRLLARMGGPSAWFHEIGHALLANVFATAGGILCRSIDVVARARRRPKPGPAADGPRTSGR